jgi:hypothetical protein
MNHCLEIIWKIKIQITQPFLVFNNFADLIITSIRKKKDQQNKTIEINIFFSLFSIMILNKLKFEKKNLFKYSVFQTILNIN